MEAINLDDALFYSKLIIKNGDYYSGLRFREYSKGYMGTTENVRFYLEKEKLKQEKALTILGSGDHVFNLILKGFKVIDAFDINKLQYFVYHLRRTMIEVLSYKEFLEVNLYFDNYRIENLREIIDRLKRHLKEDVYEYYCKILEYAKTRGSLENLYYFVIADLWKDDNLYLKNENSYLDLKSKLNDVKVNLYFGDARALHESFRNNYDIILLSNITEYFGTQKKPLTLQEYQDFINKYFGLLNGDGLLINYLYIKGGKPFLNSDILLSDLIKGDVVLINENAGYLRVRKKM